MLAVLLLLLRAQYCSAAKQSKPKRAKTNTETPILSKNGPPGAAAYEVFIDVHDLVQKITFVASLMR
jgi:aspartyl-tRNA synthetase